MAWLDALESGTQQSAKVTLHAATSSDWTRIPLSPLEFSESAATTADQNGLAAYTEAPSWSEVAEFDDDRFGSSYQPVRRSRGGDLSLSIQPNVGPDNEGLLATFVDEPTFSVTWR